MFCHVILETFVGGGQEEPKMALVAPLALERGTATVKGMKFFPKMPINGSPKNNISGRSGAFFHRFS
jgi:hypothetical protein